jgi:RNA polymerase-binding transcription factor
MELIMKKEQTEYFRQVLSEMLERLLNHENISVSGMPALIKTFSDSTDQASFKAERDFMLSISEKKQKIKEALDRIENGIYTICKTCGEDISLARLIARPTSTKCGSCKMKEIYQ